jgi:beta-glucosidase
MKKIQYNISSFIWVLSVLLLTTACSHEENNSSELYAKELIKKLTLEEKIGLLSGMGTSKSEFGDKDVPVFGIKGIPEKGIPDFIMGHGITGVRSGRDTQKYSTYFGTPMAYACSWNVNLYEEVGVAIAKEMRALGQDLNLGPTINIIRHPLGGRNWECLSEDPFLNAKFIVPYVQAMQNNGIVCGPKHFAVNNQEHNRFDINNQVDERTLREIYLPGFKAAVVEGKALNLMGSYNRLNGEFMCQNDVMLNHILREEWGFEGFVLSDFANGLRSTLKGINNGLNLEMPGAKFYGDELLKAVNTGLVAEQKVDSMLTDILKVMHRVGLFDRPRIEHQEVVHCAEHIELAKKVAIESAVLLKNEGAVLPLKKDELQSVAIIGPNAKRPASMNASNPYYLQGGGSGRTYYFPNVLVEPFTGLQEALGETTNIKYAAGCQTPDLFRSINNGEGQEIDETLIKEAVELAKTTACAIVFAGLSGSNESEGRDRSSALLPGKQNELIQRVSAVNKNTIVVLISGSYIDVSSWINQVKGFLYVPYSGEQIGTGITQLLLGEESPSGRLSITWPYAVDDYPEGSIFTGQKYSKSGESNVYSEGVFVGYRWFDKQKLDVLYPFGYGLSYSQFAYSNLQVDADTWPLKVSVDVKNTGLMEASEVVQLYVHDQESKLNKPVNELKEFKKIRLNTGETKSISFELGKDAFSNYWVENKAWAIEPGEFRISVGEHSRNLKLKAKVVL